MTKVEAIQALMNEYNGVVTWEVLYNEIERYYPNVKNSSEWKAGLRGVLYRELGKKFKRIDKSVYALIDYNEKNLIAQSENCLITEKEILTVVRTQQAKFRDSLLKQLKFCPITMIKDKRLLVASHIKPWCLSNDIEKLDVYNGFILTPLYDKLFDSGLITFTSKKMMYISPTLSKDTIQKFNLKNEYYSNLPIEGREKYLEFHNDKIFLGDADSIYFKTNI